MLQALGPEEPVLSAAAGAAPASAVRGRRPVWLATAAAGALAVVGAAAFLMLRGPAQPSPVTVAASWSRRGSRRHHRQWRSHHRSKKPLSVPPSVKEPPSQQQATVVIAPPAKKSPLPSPVQQPHPEAVVVPPPATQPQVPASQQEALIVPPPAPVAPMPSSPLDQARAAAGALPCAALDVRAGQDRMDITGFAQVGQDFDRWRASLGPVGATVTRLTTLPALRSTPCRRSSAAPGMARHRASLSTSNSPPWPAVPTSGSASPPPCPPSMSISTRPTARCVTCWGWQVQLCGMARHPARWPTDAGRDRCDGAARSWSAAGNRAGQRLLSMPCALCCQKPRQLISRW